MLPLSLGEGRKQKIHRKGAEKKKKDAEERGMKAVFIALLLVFAFALPAVAQEEQNAINMCASRLAFDLPEGWIADVPSYSPLGTIQYIRSSNASPIGGTDNIDAEEATILIYIAKEAAANFQRTERQSLIDYMQALMNRAKANSPDRVSMSFSPITAVTIQGQQAAQVTIQSADGENYMIMLELGDIVATVQLLTLKKLNAMMQWKSTALDVAQSLSFDAVRFVDETDLHLTQAEAWDNCEMAFAYPERWSPSARYFAGDNQPFESLTTFGDKDIAYYEMPRGEARIAFNITPDRGVGDSPYELDDAVNDFADVMGYEVMITTQATINGRDARISEMRSWGDSQSSVFDIEIAYNERIIVSVAVFCFPGEVDLWRDTVLAIAQTLQLNLPVKSER
jgi:hypothetical protein